MATIGDKNESANLNVLRAYAVLTVYIGHLLQTFHIERILGRVTIYDFAQTGVLIFFVHTSFVLMLSLDRLQATKWNLFAQFYIRRAFRIYPLSIITVLVMLIMRAPDFPNRQYSFLGWVHLGANLTLIQNLTKSSSYPSVLWSLPYEVQMYLCLPVLFVFIRRFRSWWLPIFLWVLDVAILELMSRLQIRGLPFLLRFTPCFLGGIIGYRLWSVSRIGLRFWAWPIAITACVAIRVAAEYTSVRDTTTVSAWIACLLLGLAIPQFSEVRVGWIRSFASVIAKYSYGIYLSHCAVFWIAFIILKDNSVWIQSIICVALSVSLPIAMYHGIERPMIVLGVRIAAASARRTGMAWGPFRNRGKLFRWDVRSNKAQSLVARKSSQ